MVVCWAIVTPEEREELERLRAAFNEAEASTPDDSAQIMRRLIERERADAVDDLLVERKCWH